MNLYALALVMEALLGWPLPSSTSGLFLVYGVILIVAGVFGTPVNLWTGISMAVVGGVFLVWSRIRPI
ncbi:hypothetical protein [Nonomuraea recticatena]|uniref:Uncharacterized protein n=1 Tax=Nonomuraea recticatena TaxID=46178 RepID=A0ABN3REI8_9ACTN